MRDRNYDEIAKMSGILACLSSAMAIYVTG